MLDSFGLRSTGTRHGLVCLSCETEEYNTIELHGDKALSPSRCALRVRATILVMVAFLRVRAVSSFCEGRGAGRAWFEGSHGPVEA